MSHIGKLPIVVPQGVTIKIEGVHVAVKGPKGQLSFDISEGIAVSVAEGQLQVQRSGNALRQKALHGLTRAILANLIVGVTQGFKKELELEGVGYRVQQNGKDLKFQLGFSHDVAYPSVEGIVLKADGQTKVIVEGIDRQKVGQVAADIRNLRPAEPYKGKGIHYAGEVIRRKEGKTGKK